MGLSCGSCSSAKRWYNIKTLDNEPFLYGKENYKNPSLLIRRANNLND